jgi:diguanylate cyclase (GGDEF)-like protein/PAS domain S-box-containing protein
METFLQRLSALPEHGRFFPATYNIGWVAVSVLLAMFACYAALAAASRIQHQQDSFSKLTWMLISAFTLGIGVWAMHFLGMLALEFDGNVSYDPVITLLSMAPAVLSAACALCLVKANGQARFSPLPRSFLLGAGIGAMHVTGMSAMRMPGEVHYQHWLFAVSLGLGVVFSYLALRVKDSRLDLGKGRNPLVAVIMGFAMSGMHYTAMAAAYLEPAAAVHGVRESGIDSNMLALLVAITTLFLALSSLTLASLSHSRQSNAQLRESEERWKSAFAKAKQTELDLRIAATAFESQAGIMITNADTVILRVNQAFTNITGYTAAEVLGKTPKILNSGHHDAEFYAEMWRSIHQLGSWEGEIWNRRKDDKTYPQQLAITVVKNEDGVVSNYVASITDITMSKAAADEIQRLAFYDPLTGLPNRQLLRDHLNLAQADSFRSGAKAAMLFIDMDNFKTLNDTLGHDIGDLLLQTVAQRLLACVREIDTVARLGGDEFVVLLEGLHQESLDASVQTEVIGNKILLALSRPYLLATYDYSITSSIGATLINGHEQSIDELLKQADIAMYQAKTDGRNALRFFDPQMQARINARVALENDLSLAVQAQQFVLYYQAQVDHQQLILGAEVLIRWRHPQRGLVSPLEFIPLAEETGLILPIGQWVLETACTQLKNWEHTLEARHLQLAVNVSAYQFRQPGFVEQVCQILYASGVNPNKLKLELTETLVHKDIEDTIIKMHALREIGVRFSMDDFGTGYSSLSSLRKLPIDQLKIDQSFVRDLATDADDAVIVETIIAMAKHLGMEVIAEGVETEVQRGFLERHGCSVCQGYLFSKPVPLADFEQLLKIV